MRLANQDLDLSLMEGITVFYCIYSLDYSCFFVKDKNFV